MSGMGDTVFLFSSFLLKSSFLRLQRPTTKPENVEWFKDVEPDTVAAISEWRKSQPGFVSINRVAVNSTTISNTYTFDTLENFNAYLVAAESNTNIIARNLYNDQNGITSVGQPV